MNSGETKLSWSLITKKIEYLCDAEKWRENISSLTTAVKTLRAAKSPRDGAVVLDATLSGWCEVIENLAPEHPLRTHAMLAIAVTFLRTAAKGQNDTTNAELDLTWDLVRRAIIQNPSLIHEVSFDGRQGSITLCRDEGEEDGQTIVRLIMCLPDKHKTNPEPVVIPAFLKTSRYFDLISNRRREPASDGSSARERNNPEITIARDDLWVAFAVHVVPNGLHEVTHHYEPSGADSLTKTSSSTSTDLVDKIEGLRRSFVAWQRLHEQTLLHSRSNELEEALLLGQSALAACADNVDLLHATRYRNITYAELGYVYRMLGRFENAVDCLEKAVAGLAVDDEERLKPLGELSVVFRHLNKLEDSKEACEEQLKTAKQLKNDSEMERAYGNLGMINYQLYQRNADISLLRLAIEQLEQRVTLCRVIKDPTTNYPAKAKQSATAREAIAFARLSLCYTALEDLPKAIEAAVECQKLSLESQDPGKIAFSRLFYGRALLLNGRNREALVQFNPKDGNTPISALSKEPSEEYRGYIAEMIDAGADLTLRDKNGYSALDYAVFGRDQPTQALLIKGLEQQLSAEDVELHLQGSILRKCYREVFQERLRPVLLNSKETQETLQDLRMVYSDTLRDDSAQAQHFDHFKYVRLNDFINQGELPKSSAGITKTYSSEEGEANLFVIFISYTWAVRVPGQEITPDDQQGNKYAHMLSALQSFLASRPELDHDNVAIWLDWACIDQEDRNIQARGVAALPMCIAQCDAMISLVDDRYYTRAWCCVEVITQQALQSAYGKHKWLTFDQEEAQDGTRRQVLRAGCLKVEDQELGGLSVDRTQCSVDSDRPKIKFLERQAKLLGQGRA